MKKSLILRLAALCTLPLMAAGAQAAETQYPLSIDNCGRKLTFEAAPKRVVSIGQNTHEILLMLGLQDKVVGTGVWLGDVLPAYQAEAAKLKRLAENQPSFESVMNEEPDLIAAQFLADVGPNGKVGRFKQFEELDVNAYISPMDCIGTENKVGGGDGARTKPVDMEIVYQEVRELAQIFNVQDKGEAVINELKASIANAQKNVANLKGKNIRLVAWFSSSKVNGDAWIAGRNGAIDYMSGVLGFVNPIETKAEWPAVSWETIAGLNPNVIVVGEMKRRKFAADAVESKIEFLTTDSVTREIDAVKNQRLPKMSVIAMNPGVRMADGIVELSKALAGYNFDDKK